MFEDFQVTTGRFNQGFASSSPLFSATAAARSSLVVSSSRESSTKNKNSTITIRVYYSQATLCRRHDTCVQRRPAKKTMTYRAPRFAHASWLKYLDSMHAAMIYWVVNLQYSHLLERSCGSSV